MPGNMESSLDRQDKAVVLVLDTSLACSVSVTNPKGLVREYSELVLMRRKNKLKDSGWLAKMWQVSEDSVAHIQRGEFYIHCQREFAVPSLFEVKVSC